MRHSVGKGCIGIYKPVKRGVWIWGKKPIIEKLKPFCFGGCYLRCAVCWCFTLAATGVFGTSGGSSDSEEDSNGNSFNIKYSRLGLSVFEGSDGKLGVVDDEGNFVLDAKWDDVAIVNGDRFRASRQGLDYGLSIVDGKIEVENLTEIRIYFGKKTMV